MGVGGGGRERYEGRRSGVVGVTRVMGGSYERKEKVRKMVRNGKMAEVNLRELR